ncbi:hypothetical protein CPT_Machias_236 [Staphylococcus phage Machias]|nr:hypothetical protein CPT_Machias_236 [Staphylococcus phage Machias]WPH64234.1 hypothetical protein [Staphylococcus phage vB_StaM_PB50]
MNKLNLDNTEDLGLMVKKLSPMNEMAEDEFRYLSDLERIFIKHNLVDRIKEKSNKRNNRNMIEYTLNNKEEFTGNGNFIFVDIEDYLNEVDDSIDMYGAIEIAFIDNEKMSEFAPFEFNEEQMGKYTTFVRCYIIAESENFLGTRCPRHFVEIELEEDNLYSIDEVLNNLYEYYTTLSEFS